MLKDFWCKRFFVGRRSVVVIAESHPYWLFEVAVSAIRLEVSIWKWTLVVSWRKLEVE